MANTSEQENALENSLNRTETGQRFATVRFKTGRKRLPKNHKEALAKRLKKRTYRDASGEVSEIPNWQIRIFHRGSESWFDLGSANKAVAVEKALEITTHIQAHGWDAALATYKPGKAAQAQSVATVGDFLAAIQATATARPKTVNDYAKAFRAIAADIAKIDGGKLKYDYRTGGREKWLAKVHAVKMASITPDKVQAWKIGFLKRAGTDPVKLRAARISVNSLMRQAKSLFAPKLLAFVNRAMLPEKLPFDGVKFEPRQSMKYRSDFDIEAIIQTACGGGDALPDEQRKIFLLAVMAGLRRNEIDKLEWSAFRWNEGVIRIQATKFFTPKSEDSSGDVDIDPELMAVFRGYHARATGAFVVESEVQPKPGAAYTHYRCERIFTALTKWLRAHGVSGNRPLHTLRKEYGSQICAKFGIYAASHALRHGDIAITSQHYLDSRKRVTVGLGGLLANVPDNVVEGAAFSAVKEASSKVKAKRIGGEMSEDNLAPELDEDAARLKDAEEETYLTDFSGRILECDYGGGRYGIVTLRDGRQIKFCRRRGHSGEIVTTYGSNDERFWDNATLIHTVYKTLKTRWDCFPTPSVSDVKEEERARIMREKHKGAATSGGHLQEYWKGAGVPEMYEAVLDVKMAFNTAAWVAENPKMAVGLGSQPDPHDEAKRRLSAAVKQGGIMENDDGREYTKDGVIFSLLLEAIRTGNPRKVQILAKCIEAAHSLPKTEKPISNVAYAVRKAARKVRSIPTLDNVVRELRRMHKASAKNHTTDTLRGQGFGWIL